MVTSEKRARTAVTIENRMKTIAERLRAKDSVTVGPPSSKPPSFIRRHGRGRKLVLLVITRSRAREARRHSENRVARNSCSMR